MSDLCILFMGGCVKHWPYHILSSMQDQKGMREIAMEDSSTETCINVVCDFLLNFHWVLC
jgi:hypothetical protein